MLKATQELLLIDDVDKMRKWLNEPGAKVFRKLVNSKLHENQINATKEFCDERDSHEEDGRKLMLKSAHYRHALEVMNEFATTKERLYTVKITEE